MPAVTFDGRSFMLDGRRIWLVSGSIHYARVPRELWADRIHAARLAGLNTIETPVYWYRHEPRPGQFDFKGDNDLRHFVKLIGEAGLYCILRPGPFVGSGVDFGGLPAWLMGIPNVQLRTNSGPFLEACSRYLTAVADQVRDLQVTSPGRGGPLILVQNESAWTCSHDAISHGYLGELSRYLREAGITVPTVNANNLWQGVEGEIDGWTGDGPMLSTMRQLATVRPDQPRLAIEFEVAPQPAWGIVPPERHDGPTLQRHLAEVLAGAGQFNLHPFHGGTNFGFSAGRLPEHFDAFATTTADPDAPLSESGGPGPAYAMSRRICTFASRFARVLANLDPSYRPVSLDPEPGSAAASVVHCVGPQGGVAFAFAPESARGGKGQSDGYSTTLLLPNGSTLPVHMGQQQVAWCLLGVQLVGRATLDYCSLCAFGVVGRIFVCFGPAGAEGEISISGSPITVTVPKGRTPLVLDYEGVTVVVCSEEQIDTCYLTEGAVLVGIGGLRADGTPIPSAAGGQYTRIDAGGEVHHRSFSANGGRGKAAPKVPMGPWSVALTEDYTSGESARFASIPGPAELTALGSPYGYGWYRIILRNGASKRTHLRFPDAADRMHIFLDGQTCGLIGAGPAATDEIIAPLRKGQQTIVVLADNLGRVSGGSRLGERKGLYGHLWETAAIRPGKPAVKTGAPVDVLAFRAPLWEMQAGDHTDPDRLTWTIQHRKKTPIFVRIADFPGRGLLLLNERPVRFLERGTHEYVHFTPEDLTKGNNHFQIATIPAATRADAPVADAHAHSSAIAHSITFWEGLNPVSAKADWAFARWEPPMGTLFHAAARGEVGAKPTGKPLWWKCTFTPPDANLPVFFEPHGLTKGVYFVNGRHVGRYFVATGDAKAVPPQSRYLIPEPWLTPGGQNELVVFDEHGGNPAKARLCIDEGPPPIRA